MNKTFFKPIPYLLKNIHKNLGQKAFYVRNASTDKIEIPIRIKRGPTDILKAIASTVQVDDTGPAYKFQDDPYLTPLSQADKRRYALSKEAGRKSARWIRDKHGDIFNYQADDPIIKDFIPKIQYEENDINNSTVLEAIENVQVIEAIDMYKVCLDKNIELPDETLQKLLEFLCFFNCEEGENPLWTEEQRGKSVLFNSKFIRTWKDKGIAEQIFEKIKGNGSQPYCALIRGMCHYCQNERGFALFQSALEQNLILDTNTYNSVIQIGPMQALDYESQWAFVTNMLTKMVENKVKPNVGTLTSVTNCFKSLYSWNKSTTIILQVLKEFKMLGIEPSLASYNQIIRSFYRKRDITSPVLPSIIDKLEGKSFTIQDVNDTWFFVTAMECSHNFLLANKIHDLLMVGDNIKFLGENVKETAYYRYYFLQALDYLPFENFMEFYDRFSPFIFTPDYQIIQKILRTLQVLDRVTELPRIWSDIVLFGNVYKEEFIIIVLSIANEHNLETVDEDLATKLSTMTSDLFDRVQKILENKKEGNDTIIWTADMVGNCISILSRCGNAKRGLEILEIVINNPIMIRQTLFIDCLQKLFQALIEQKDEKCYIVVKYAADNDFPQAEQMASEMRKSLELSPQTDRLLTKLFPLNTELNPI